MSNMKQGSPIPTSPNDNLRDYEVISNDYPERWSPEHEALTCKYIEQAVTDGKDPSVTGLAEYLALPRATVSYHIKQMEAHPTMGPIVAKLVAPKLLWNSEATSLLLTSMQTTLDAHTLSQILQRSAAEVDDKVRSLLRSVSGRDKIHKTLQINLTENIKSLRDLAAIARTKLTTKEVEEEFEFGKACVALEEKAESRLQEYEDFLLFQQKEMISSEMERARKGLLDGTQQLDRKFAELMQQTAQQHSANKERRIASSRRIAEQERTNFLVLSAKKRRLNDEEIYGRKINFNDYADSPMTSTLYRTSQISNDTPSRRDVDTSADQLPTSGQFLLDLIAADSKSQETVDSSSKEVTDETTNESPLRTLPTTFEAPRLQIIAARIGEEEAAFEDLTLDSHNAYTTKQAIENMIHRIDEFIAELDCLGPSNQRRNLILYAQDLQKRMDTAVRILGSS